MRESDSLKPSLDAPEGAGWVLIDTPSQDGGKTPGRKLWVWGWESIPAGATKRPASEVVQPILHERFAG